MKKTKAGNFHASERPPSYDEPYIEQREVMLHHRHGKTFGIIMVLIYLALAILILNS